MCIRLLCYEEWSVELCIYIFLLLFLPITVWYITETKWLKINLVI